MQLSGTRVTVKDLPCLVVRTHNSFKRYFLVFLFYSYHFLALDYGEWSTNVATNETFFKNHAHAMIETKMN